MTFNSNSKTYTDNSVVTYDYTLLQETAAFAHDASRRPISASNAAAYTYISPDGT